MGNKRNRRNRSAKKADLGPIDLRKSLRPLMGIVKNSGTTSPKATSPKMVRFKLSPPPPLHQRPCQLCERHLQSFNHDLCDGCLEGPYGGQWKYSDWHSYYDDNAYDIPVDPLNEVLNWKPVFCYPRSITSLRQLISSQNRGLSRALYKRK